MISVLGIWGKERERSGFRGWELFQIASETSRHSPGGFRAKLAVSHGVILIVHGTTSGDVSFLCTADVDRANLGILQPFWSLVALIVPFARFLQLGEALAQIPFVSRCVHFCPLLLLGQLRGAAADLLAREGLVFTGLVQHRLDFMASQRGVHTGDIVVPELHTLVFHGFPLEKLLAVPFVEALIVAVLSLGTFRRKRNRHDVSHFGPLLSSIEI